MSRPVFEKTGRPAPKFPEDFLCSTPSTSLYGGISNGNITMKSVAKKDDAVSPVIGTILLVAITVVLVAIVAAVVMVMVSGVGDSKTIGMSVTPYANTTEEGIGVILTVTGGKDASLLKNVTLYMDGVTEWDPAEITGFAVGKPIYVTATVADDDIPTTGVLTVTGSFTDGATSVIYQGRTTIPAKVTT